MCIVVNNCSYVTIFIPQSVVVCTLFFVYKICVLLQVSNKRQLSGLYKYLCNIACMSTSQPHKFRILTLTLDALVSAALPIHSFRWAKIYTLQSYWSCYIIHTGENYILYRLYKVKHVFGPPCCLCKSVFRNNFAIKLFTNVCLKGFITICIKFGSDCFYENQLIVCGQKSAKRSLLLST